MNTNTTLAAQALRFHSLHDAVRPLALVNVWDVASALVVEAAGAQAVATTSAGVAWSQGMPDGDRLGREQALDVVARIVAAVEVPVTADIESGFAATTADVAATIDGLLTAGVVGINIEDGVCGVGELAARITVARTVADRAGVRLFINARTDVFLRGIGAPGQRVTESINRAARYLEAGADGIFVPGVVDAVTITELTAGIGAPVNVMASPGSLSVGELARVGVARVSLGSSVAEAAYAVVQRATKELLGSGTYESVAGGLEYGVLNGLLDSSNALSKQRTEQPTH